MKKVFRNKIAQKYFEHFINDNYVSECGIDDKGLVYVAWLNGNIDRYERKRFVKEASDYYSKESEEWVKKSL